MDAPEEHADPILGRARERAIPEEHLPVERPPLGPEGRREGSAVGLVSLLRVLLETMARTYQVPTAGNWEEALATTHARR